MVTAAFTKMLGLPERRDYLRTHSTPPLLGGPAGLQRCTPQLKKKLFCNSNKHPYVATALKTNRVKTQGRNNLPASGRS